MDTLETGLANLLIGEVNGATNKQCSIKAAGSFLNIRGLCPEEPNKFGHLLSSDPGALCQDHGSSRGVGKRYGQHGQAKHHHLCCRGKLPCSDFEFTVGGKKVQLSSVFHDGCPDLARARPAGDTNRFDVYDAVKVLGEFQLGPETIKGQLVIFDSLRQRCRLDR